MAIASLWREWTRAASQRKIAEIEYNKAVDAFEAYKNDLRKGLPITDDEPCKIAALGDGYYAVHVYVTTAMDPNQLHIVTLSDITEMDK